MDLTAAVTLLGGLGMFLLGIHHLTEGLKDLAGDSLRSALQRLISGRLSAIVSGVVFTALVQSSTAAILTVIGFVSAGLLTFGQAIGVIMGATLGTTTTPWLVAVFGFRVSVSAAALPILGVGAFLWLVAKGKLRSCGAILAGFGLLFTGIEYMQNGNGGHHLELHGLHGFRLAVDARRNRRDHDDRHAELERRRRDDARGRACRFAHLRAGLRDDRRTEHWHDRDDRAAHARRRPRRAARGAGAHPLQLDGRRRRHAAARLRSRRRRTGWGLAWTIPTGCWRSPLSAASSSSWASWCSIHGSIASRSCIVRITGKGSESAISRLDPTVAEAGGPIALEAAWRAILETAQGAVAAVRGPLAGEPTKYDPPADAVQQLDHFLESLSLETTDMGTVGPRLVRLCHALDHLTQLHEDLTRIPPPVAGGGEVPSGFQAGAQALAAWLDATRDPNAAPDPAILAALEEASRQLSAECKASRERTLDDLALQRVPTATARAFLDTLAWADRTLYHAWRLADSLRAAAAE